MMWIFRRENVVHALALIIFFNVSMLMGDVFVHGEDTGEVTMKPILKSVFVMIERKTERDLLTDQALFLITDATKFFNEKGEEITIEDLPVPCKSQIYYQPFTQTDPNAFTVTVKYVFPEANTTFFKPPE